MSHPAPQALKMQVSSLPSTPTQVLICRNYRGDVDMSEVEHFMPILMEKEEEGMLSPILAHGGVRFMWIKHNNLYCIPLAPVWVCRHLPSWVGHSGVMRPGPARLELPAAWG